MDYLGIQAGDQVEVYFDTDSFGELDKGAPGVIVQLDYTVLEGFDTPNGKFANDIGNVALLDCHYMEDLLPLGIDFCSVAMTVDGVLNDQVSVYTGSQSNMNKILSQIGIEMMNALSIGANITTSTPLSDQVSQLDMISIFMNTTFDTIIAFLAILCVQLIYSLMLSDVEEKTFEFGMLRALGFNKGNVIATVLV